VAGEADAVTIVESYGRRLAEGIAPVLLALDPALAVMGISQFPTPETAAAADILLTAARRHAQTLLVDPPHWQLSAFGRRRPDQRGPLRPLLRRSRPAPGRQASSRIRQEGAPV
jgi:predicted NBD/HSP70 family sugar kinase